MPANPRKHQHVNLRLYVFMNSVSNVKIVIILNLLPMVDVSAIERSQWFR